MILIFLYSFFSWEHIEYKKEKNEAYLNTKTDKE